MYQGDMFLMGVSPENKNTQETVLSHLLISLYDAQRIWWQYFSTYQEAKNAPSAFHFNIIITHPATHNDTP